MLFNSYVFILLFLPVTLLLFYILCHFQKLQLATGFLVLASLIFYMYWDIRYLWLLLVSMGFNYLWGKQIEQKRTRLALVTGLTVNLLILGYYKYTGFLVTTINSWFGTGFHVSDIILPLGISFFTFTQIAYLIDAYRGEIKGYSFLHYSLFVTFFPHLIAGPILYHKHIIPQFQNASTYVFSHENMARGVTMFTLGLFKKVIIADSLIPWVQPIFTQAASATFLDAWIGAVAFVLQLYYDFSGYSDMAIGLGWMINIQLPINFNSPYKADSIIKFWNRWHITMITFFNNYLYLPIRGKSRTMLHSLMATFITMVLAGLWHGAGWTYIIWGALNGCFLIINHIWRQAGRTIPPAIARAITFVSVVITGVFFRAASVGDALQLLKAMLDINNFSNLLSMQSVVLVGHAFEAGAGLAILLLAVNVLPNSNQLLKRFQPTWMWAFCTIMLLALSLYKMDRASEFLYFQF